MNGPIVVTSYARRKQLLYSSRARMPSDCVRRRSVYPPGRTDDITIIRSVAVLSDEVGVLLVR